MLQECYFCMQIYQNWYICMQYIPDVVYLRYANHNDLRDPIYMTFIDYLAGGNLSLQLQLEDNLDNTYSSIT